MYNFILLVFFVISFSLIFLILFNPVKNNSLHNIFNSNNPNAFIKPIDRNTIITRIIQIFSIFFFILCIVIFIFNIKNTIINI